MLGDLPKNGPTDPIEYYRHPWVGKLYLKRINQGLAMLPDAPIARALEVGYGAGAVQIALLEHVKELHGIDLDADPEVLRNYFAGRTTKPHLRQGNAYELPYDEDYFDLVVSFSVFEHLQDYRRALSEVFRVLHKGGKFLLGMPSVNRLMEAAFFAIGYKGINDMHITTPKAVAMEFESIGFKLLDSNPLDFPMREPFGVRLYYNWILEKP
jgi:ubiquinone/menaquinone biosynthesis C-methylase UbiE